ncbi:hypothetical protein KBZ94_41955 [Streptomyces sp. RM72]|nr:hypothetical protein [Streptomyces sp. RM72]
MYVAKVPEVSGSPAKPRQGTPDDPRAASALQPLRSLAAAAQEFTHFTRIAMDPAGGGRSTDRPPVREPTGMAIRLTPSTHQKSTMMRTCTRDR